MIEYLKTEKFMQAIGEKTKNLNIINHPIILQNLAILRAKETNCNNFRIAAEKITQLLMYEAVKTLPLSNKIISTPFEDMETKIISPNLDIIVSPILRAGLIFEKAALDLFPMAKVFHIGMYRNEKTLNPVWYYNKLPNKLQNPENIFVYITDPMLATGGSLLEAIKLYADKNIPQNQIKVVCILATPEGVSKVLTHYPNVEITIAALDRTLNNKGYILPGLGDAGDRIFNTL